MISCTLMVAIKSPEIVWSNPTSSSDLVFLTALFAKRRLPKAVVLLKSDSSFSGVVSARNKECHKNIS